MYVYLEIMPHRTITVSEEAYRALSERKSKKESFTDVILRLASERGNASKLLALIRSFEADEELAANIEKAMAWRATLKLRRADV